jgi:hypothetical protein
VNAREPRWGRRHGLRLALIFLAAGLASVARAAEVQIAVIANGECPPALHERLAEQVAEIAHHLSWSCLGTFDAEEPFRSPNVDPDTLQIWVDVRPGSEARLTLRDVRADRFVVRRIPLPRGLDEIGREEIGQIVRSAALAVLAGPAATMTRQEARAEISRWTQPPPSLAAEPNRRSAPPARTAAHLVRIGPVISARAFAASIPLVAEVGVAAAVGGARGLGAWLDVAYQLPARDDASPVGVQLDALAVRAGLLTSIALRPSWTARLGVGGGFTRTSFAPLGDHSTITPAPSGAFFSMIGRVSASVDVRARKSTTAGVAIFCDAVGADVHYDLREPDGSTRRVLTPFRLQPGVALQIGWGS